jgi:hypothetical protein
MDQADGGFWNSIFYSLALFEPIWGVGDHPHASVKGNAAITY